MENLEEMDKFLNPSKTEPRSSNYSIMSNETEALTKSLSTKKSPGPHGFNVEFHQTFEKDLTPILLKLFYKTERKKCY
jgi:hypothetical protein